MCGTQCAGRKMGEIGVILFGTVATLLILATIAVVRSQRRTNASSSEHHEDRGTWPQ